MSLGVVGSRYFTNYSRTKELIDNFIVEIKEKHNVDINTVVSGGCRGVDTLAKRFSQERKMELKEFCYLYDPKIGNRGYHLRNQQIVDNSEFLLALPDKNSKGTWSTINKSKKKGIPVKVVMV